MIASAGGSQLLPKLIGIPKAKELIYTGKILNGEESKSIGLVNEIADDAFKCALVIAQQIVKKGPLGVRAAKQLINNGSESSL